MSLKKKLVYYVFLLVPFIGSIAYYFYMSQEIYIIILGIILTLFARGLIKYEWG